MTLSDFAAHAGPVGPLVRPVVTQIGGWDSFCESARDIVEHGADTGWAGFTYYGDTCAFVRRNRSRIAECAESMAKDCDYNGVVTFVAMFRCLDGVTESDVARALYSGGEGDGIMQVENALAWFALEEVCRAYTESL